MSWLSVSRCSYNIVHNINSASIFLYFRCIIYKAPKILSWREAARLVFNVRFFIWKPVTADSENNSQLPLLPLYSSLWLVLYHISYANSRWPLVRFDFLQPIIRVLFISIGQSYHRAGQTRGFISRSWGGCSSVLLKGNCCWFCLRRQVL